MTDLTPPPESPALQLRWALETLREWSRPEYRNLLGRDEILKAARAIIKQHGLQNHPVQKTPRSQGPRRPGTSRRPARPPRRHRVP